MPLPWWMTLDELLGLRFGAEGQTVQGYLDQPQWMLTDGQWSWTAQYTLFHREPHYITLARHLAHGGYVDPVEVTADRLGLINGRHRIQAARQQRLPGLWADSR